MELVIEAEDLTLGMACREATAGAMCTMPSTRSGWPAATIVPQSAPHELATRTAWFVLVASSTASVSPTYSSTR